ncbi:hypothetical protein BC833DRAFT_589412 [Globomyces pollinis-pini]|nr:hypothetical protein BC833DRAFT_589412 [Globomyces pollinis-pini]
MPATTIAIVGATGNIGNHITNAKELLGGFEKKGAEIVSVGGSYQVDSLVAALHGVQVVISAASGFALQDQLPIIEASKRAGVKTFYPSEYGIDDQEHPLVHPVIDAKRSIRKAVLDAGLELVVSFTGFFGEWSKTIPIIGNGNTKYGLAPLKQLGQVVAKSIGNPSVLQGSGKEYYLIAQVYEYTWNEILDEHTRATGIEWKRAYMSIEDAEKEIAAASDPYSVFGTYLRLWMAKGYGVSKKNIADRFQLPVVDLYTLFGGVTKK